ncbi:unnamed protein product, partial [Discosporangium mesarthrocarpum]
HPPVVILRVELSRAGQEDTRRAGAGEGAPGWGLEEPWGQGREGKEGGGIRVWSEGKPCSPVAGPTTQPKQGQGQGERRWWRIEAVLQSLEFHPHPHPLPCEGAGEQKGEEDVLPPSGPGLGSGGARGAIVGIVEALGQEEGASAVSMTSRPDVPKATATATAAASTAGESPTVVLPRGNRGEVGADEQALQGRVSWVWEGYLPDQEQVQRAMETGGASSVDAPPPAPIHELCKGSSDSGRSEAGRPLALVRVWSAETGGTLAVGELPWPSTACGASLQHVHVILKP